MTKLTKAAFQSLIDENLDWLYKQPFSLERDHIICIVAASVGKYYPEEKEGE